ncbi:hypothetical protein ACFX2A_008939 [Malus domestica]
MLSNGTELTIKKALYSPRFGRTLLSFRDIRDNQYHVETTEENDSEFLCITSYKYGQKRIHKKLERLPSGLYITIRSVETHQPALCLGSRAFSCFGMIEWDILNEI